MIYDDLPDLPENEPSKDDLVRRMLVITTELDGHMVIKFVVNAPLANGNFPLVDDEGLDLLMANGNDEGLRPDKRTAELFRSLRHVLCVAAVGSPQGHLLVVLDDEFNYPVTHMEEMLHSMELSIHRSLGWSHHPVMVNYDPPRHETWHSTRSFNGFQLLPRQSFRFRLRNLLGLFSGPMFAQPKPLNRPESDLDHGWREFAAQHFLKVRIREHSNSPVASPPRHTWRSRLHDRRNRPSDD